MYVVATAGHVDHGKSTLVRALTGQDPDRLEEERRRGLSIRLGYCWTELPGLGQVAFVDVPGHERFLPTTLSGLGPVPAALFVVAADDPWMPQAAEHLAALDAVGVRHGVLAVTRADLADPGPALAEARERLAATSLAGAEAVVVSGRTGAGLEDLRGALGRMLHDLPEPDAARPARLWVDRRFAVHGTGTVVTGTLQAGTVATGDRLLTGDGQEVRVRGVQCLGRPVPAATAPARVALDLGGRVPDGVAPGAALVAPGAFDAVTVLDVALTGAGTPPHAPLLHVGSHASSVHHRGLGPGLARLRLSVPLPLQVCDRGVLRDPGSRALWGVQVLDTDPAPLRRRGAAAARAGELAGLEPTLAAHLTSRGLVRREELDRRGVRSGPVPDGTVTAAGWLVSPQRAARLRVLLEELVGRAEDPRGVTAEAAARALSLPDSALVEALVAAPLRLDSGRISGAGGDLPGAAVEALASLRARLSEAPFAAPPADDLPGLGLDPATLGLLASRGLVLRPAPSVVLLPEAEERAVEVLATLPQPFTASEARRALGTSRRVALPLLALLDKRGHTVRLADDRRRMRR